jgi:hypothetical protein
MPFTTAAFHTHLHITPFAFKNYILPTRIKLISSLAEPVITGMQQTKSIDQIFNFLITPGEKMDFAKSPSYMDHQLSGENGFYNIQLQLKVKKGKSTVAKALIDSQLKDITCPDCKANVVDAFFRAIDSSFAYTLKASTCHKTSNSCPSGISFIVSAPKNSLQLDCDNVITHVN